MSAKINKDGTFGLRHSTDVAERQEFTALLKEARRQLAKLAEEPGRVKEIVGDACALTQLVMTNPSIEKFPRQAKVRCPATIVWFVVQFR